MATIRHDGEEWRASVAFAESKIAEGATAAAAAFRSSRATAGLRGAMEDIKRHIAPVKDAIEPILERLMTKKRKKAIPRARGPRCSGARDLHRGRAADRAALVGADALHDASDGDVRAAQIPRARRAKFRARRLSPLILAAAAARAASSHRSWFLGVLLLIFSAVVQLGAASLVMRPEHIKPSRVKPGCYALLGFVAAPAVHVRPGARRRLHVPVAHARRRAAAADLGRERQAAEHRADGHRGDARVEENNPGAVGCR